MNYPNTTKYIVFYLLGFGRSSRPVFKGKTPEDAENFWIDSFEIWRQQLGLKIFVLLVHSLGGFLSCSYALKYPENLKKVILCAPVELHLGS